MKGRRRATTFLILLQLVAMLWLPLSKSAAATRPPSEWVVGPQKRIVILTFDGQTRSKGLLRVLGDLAERDARASFFLPGQYVARHPEKARLVLEGNHKLGNGGWDKQRFTKMSSEGVRKSIRRAQAALRKVNVYPRPFVRPPNGARNVSVLRAAGSMGYRSVRWTYRARGGKVRKVARQVVRNAQAGSIISLDLWRASHRAAVARIVDGLKRKGFKFKTIESLQHSHAIRWDVTVRAGSRGKEVSYLQKTLRDITYPAGASNGSFGYATLQAVYAFEKTHRLTRDGVVTPQQMTDIAVAQRPRTPKRNSKNFIDVDISRQVLFEIRKGRVIHTLPISSGNEEMYTTDDGEQRRAHTPRGNFSIVRKIAGRRESDLGVLWWPNYFVGGYAIHGSDSVPTHPASHGCVRIPRYAEKKFFRRNPIGRPVFVHN
jgi:peptidoglycan/xylan/chitin deacetylase (PgdA/CDA1 family)/lipoprotein-anchoring transpeptidase ErfK/SrfK